MTPKLKPFEKEDVVSEQKQSKNLGSEKDPNKEVTNASKAKSSEESDK